MINRSKMPRQLRAQGGITNVTPREGFFLGGIKDRIRRLIPNEIADIAVKAAPFVAPFQPGIAAAMRGIGRFDQRGSISDALKQGALTFGFGKGVGALGGAQSDSLFGGQTFTKEGFKQGPIGRLFQRPEVSIDSGRGGTSASARSREIANLGTSSTPATTTGKGLKIFKENIDFMDSIPIVRELPDIVKQQILVGGVTGAATYVYEKFLAEEPPQEEGEDYYEYMERRRINVGNKMRTYFDNYFKFDKDYSGMTDEQKDAFVARYNLARGGRVGYQTGGITMANTLQQNIAANRAQAAGIQALLNQARASAGLPTVQAPAQTTTAAPTQTTTAAPAQTTTAAPAPSITKSTSAPAQTTAPTQGLASMAMPSQMIPAQMTSTPGTGGRMPGSPQMMNPLPPSQLPSFFKYFNTTGARVDPTTYDPNTDSYVVPNPNKGGAFETITGPFDKYGIPKSFKPSGPENVVGNFGPGGMMGTIIQGKFYPAEEAAIDRLGVEKYAQYMAEGGRVGFSEGSEKQAKKDKLKKIGYEDILLDTMTLRELINLLNSEEGTFTDSSIYRPGGAKGGIMSMPTGDMRKNKAGIIERDYRDKGGFVPVGIKEKADDVPAMLSKNEFVMTANAVRGAGNGSIEKGAQRMYDTMKKLEKRVV